MDTVTEPANLVAHDRTADRKRENEKTDGAEHLKLFNHVGLLVNETPGTAGLLFS